MKNENMFAEIDLSTPKIIKGRSLLFCIEGKCMTGKIEKFKVISNGEKAQIEVSFIEPSFFKNEIKIGKRFTIQEASTVLAEGIITSRFRS